MIAAKWDITSRCNLRCTHCSVAGLYFSGQRYPELSLNQQLSVLDNLAEGGVRYLSLLGGEPFLLRDRLLTIVSHAKRLGIAVGIVTNGLLLSEENAQALIDLKLDHITVSLESAEAAGHDRIRGQGNFDRLIGNLRRAIELRGKSQYPRVTVNSVLTRANKDSFTEIPRLCCELGADEWTALTLNYTGNAHTNLPTLILSPREHTEVALELSRQLPSLARSGRAFAVNIQLLYPLVWEHLKRRYNVTPPWPQICCSAARSLVYVDPGGEMHVCDRVHGTIYSGATIRGESILPVDLTRNSFAGAWASSQYARMFEFARDPATYTRYNPCRRCKYLAAGLCEPCPLYSLEGSDITFSECLEAEQFLGDISGPIDWSEIPATEQRGRYQEAWNRPDTNALSAEWENQAQPVPAPGVRHFRWPNGDGVLIEPLTMRSLKLNPMANAVWESIDGHRTTGEIVGNALDLYRGAVESLAHRPVAGSELTQLTAQVAGLLHQFRDSGLIGPAETA